MAPVYQAVASAKTLRRSGFHGATQLWHASHCRERHEYVM
jgi:hypothetical protein